MVRVGVAVLSAASARSLLRIPRLPEMGIYSVRKYIPTVGIRLARFGRLWRRWLESLFRRWKERDARNSDDRKIGGANERRRHDGSLPAGAGVVVGADP